MFKWLFGNKIKKTESYSVTSCGPVEEKIIYGEFVYECFIYCPSDKSNTKVIVTVGDDKTEPLEKCRCGQTIPLFPAPIVEERKLGNQVFRTRRGELTSHLVKHHKVSLGKTLKYKIHPPKKP